MYSLQKMGREIEDKAHERTLIRDVKVEALLNTFLLCIYETVYLFISATGTPVIKRAQ